MNRTDKLRHKFEEVLNYDVRTKETIKKYGLGSGSAGAAYYPQAKYWRIL